MNLQKPSTTAAGDKFRIRLLLAIALCAYSGCTSTYPFIMMTDEHPSKTGTIDDTQHKISYRYEATYRVGEHVASKIVLVISNNSAKELSLSNGRIKISSRNVDYEMNDRFIPLPDRTVAAHGSTSLTFVGVGRKPADEPWQQIAGEQMTVTLRGLALGGLELPGHTVRFIPLNPKL